MKNLKLASLSLLLLFMSCNNNEDDNNFIPEQSTATRMYLNEVKESGGQLTEPVDPQNPINTIDLCFDLVFPIQVIYNNGNRITINAKDGLKQAVYSENLNFHINSIVYPFKVIDGSNNNELTVQNEAQFLDLLTSCNVNEIGEILTMPNCFYFVYPLSVIKNDGSQQAISNITNLNQLLASMPSNEYWVDFKYPFQIIYNNENITIDNIWEFYDYLDCTPDQSDCFHTLEYNPVCVQTPNGVFQFGNPSIAYCSGFTSADFVNCE